jgi:vancomycin resistance protein YoaR
MSAPGTLRALLLGLIVSALASAAAPLLTGPERAARPIALTLLLDAPEPTLRSGQIEYTAQRRTYTLSITPEQARQSLAQGSLSPLTQVLKPVYRQIEARTPRDARFEWTGNAWVARAQTGWTVRRPETAQAVLAALKTGQTQARVALRLSAPERSVRVLKARRVTTRLATGQSSFAGSPDFRIHNIRVGSQKLSGRWLSPGEVFDFNALVGRITSARGFVPGYVITGGTLSLEDGGGICQVSTTVFRAAYQAGLAVVERHAHSHQVAYYDPTGYEATVYAPSLNLRFRNDTRAPLLLQASWDLKAQTLRMDLFGAPPDRTVSVSEPKISNRRLAPPPTFLADAKLKPGQTERIDMPASGMQVSLKRTVKFNDGRVRTSTLSSDYRPWGGVFAVHPDDPRRRR